MCTFDKVYHGPAFNKVLFEILDFAFLLFIDRKEWLFFLVNDIFHFFSRCNPEVI